jgi:E3 ubiquitin-protein ligase CBL
LSSSKTSSLDLSSSNPTEQQQHQQTKTINQIIMPQDDEIAPPIPPRKSATFNNCTPSDNNRLQKMQPTPPISHTNSVEKNNVGVGIENKVPSMSAVAEQKLPDQQIVKQLMNESNNLIDLSQNDDDSNDDDDDDEQIICGPAETITGIIDTRPLDQRSYISFASLTNNLTTNFNLITINDINSSSASSTNKDNNLSAKDAECKSSNNTYLLKSNQLNNFSNNNNHINNNNNFSNINGTNNHQRHMSVPIGGSQTPIKTLPTSSSTFNQASINQKVSNNIISSPLKANNESKNSVISATSITPQSMSVLSSSILSSSSSTSSSSPCANNSKVTNLQLYENVKMKSAGNLITLNNFNNNHHNESNITNSANSSSSNNVSYENINLEYINRLMHEGYSKENVMAALSISRNNFEMACDILHEFVASKQ